MHLVTATHSVEQKDTTHRCTLQVKITVSHHDIKDDELVNQKSLVFLLDEIVEQPKKKKKVTLTLKNFGAQCCIPKIKSNTETMEIAWRCRLYPVE